MSEERENLKHDDEYEYSDEQISDSYIVEPPAPPKRSLVSRLFNKKLLIILGLLIAIAIVYKFLGPTGKGSSTEANIQPTVQVPPAPAIAPALPAQPPQVPPVNTNQQVLNQIAAQTVNQAQALKELQNNIAQLNNNVQQLRNSYTNLSDSVQILNQQVAQLQQKVMAKPVVKKVYHKPVPKYVYHLKAVVPGRAWLESNTGFATTVKVGDRLQGYGVVTAINASQGWVGTSSGIIIQYGPDDS